MVQWSETTSRKRVCGMWERLRRKHRRDGITLPSLADILDMVFSNSVRKFVISHNWESFPVMVPLSHVGPQGSIFGPFVGPISPGYSAVEVYFMKDGESLHRLDDGLNFLPFITMSLRMLFSVVPPSLWLLWGLLFNRPFAKKLSSSELWHTDQLCC